MSHPNVKCGRAKSKLEDNPSYSELYKSESSDEDMPSCLMHPNVNIARDVKHNSLQFHGLSKTKNDLEKELK
jgi:hypothetical protein